MSVSTSTSRVGRKPVMVPHGVEVKIQGQELSIKGPKGKFIEQIHPDVQIELEGNLIKVSPNKNAAYCRTGSGARLRKSVVGTARAEIANMVHGATHLFEKKLILIGVGYKAQSKGKVLDLSLGFSHPVNFPVPEGLTIETPSVTEIVIKGADRVLVGAAAATIRGYRPPEPYKGKGIRYSDEKIVLKETKKK